MNVDSTSFERYMDVETICVRSELLEVIRTGRQEEEEEEEEEDETSKNAS